VSLCLINQSTCIFVEAKFVIFPASSVNLPPVIESGNSLL
jgi:hypothetical protein